MLASSPKTSGTWVALLGLALIACGGRTTGLGGTESSSGGSGGGSVAPLLTSVAPLPC
jgi:hypothetical protein